MNFLIVSGMSGAGKTVALKTLEDLGYYCVDNLPVFLIPQFAELCLDSENYKKTAVGVDIRSGNDLEKLGHVLEELEEKRIDYQILFLDASDPVLLKRYKETRRNHPLAREGRIEEGLKKERIALKPIKDKSDYVIDTTSLLTRELREELEKLFRSEEVFFQNLVITVMSFGFKYGIPQDADIVIDVRFLPNPFYIENLKEMTGLEEPVRRYIMENNDSILFMEKLYDLVGFLLPKYVKEGKNQLVIAIGCTGGKHRSVAVSDMLFQKIKEFNEYIVKSFHRDISR